MGAALQSPRDARLSHLNGYPIAEGLTIVISEACSTLCNIPDGRRAEPNKREWERQLPVSNSEIGEARDGRTQDVLAWRKHLVSY